MDVETVYYTVLGTSGLDQFLRETSKARLKKALVLMYLVIALPSFVLAQGYSMATGKMSSRVMNMSLGLSAFNIATKATYFLVYIDRMRALMIDPAEFQSTRALGSEADGIISPMADRILSIYSSYKKVGYLTALSWISLPVFTSPQGLFLIGNSTKVNRVLPTQYPFPTDGFLVPQFIFVYDSIMAFGAVVFFLAVNSFYSTVILMLSTQIQVVNASLPHLSFKAFVQDHRKILKMIGEVRNAMSPLLAVQLLVSAITLCFGIFEFARVSETDDTDEVNQAIQYAQKAGYLSILFLELLLFCWLSSELQTSSESVGLALYYSNWIDKGTSECKSVHISMVMSERKVSLTALSMVTLNLQTFVDVLRLSYSYYTVLRQLNTE